MWGIINVLKKGVVCTALGLFLSCVDLASLWAESADEGWVSADDVFRGAGAGASTIDQCRSRCFAQSKRTVHDIKGSPSSYMYEPNLDVGMASFDVAVDEDTCLRACLERVDHKGAAISF